MGLYLYLYILMLHGALDSAQQALELELIQARMTQKLLLWVELIKTPSHARLLPKAIALIS